jgi:hypothetical protein
MAKPKLKQKTLQSVLDHVRQAIRDCWSAQSALEPDDVEFKLLNEQVTAFQDVHTCITGYELGEEGGDDDAPIAMVEDEAPESPNAKAPGTVPLEDLEEDEDDDEKEE